MIALPECSGAAPSWVILREPRTDQIDTAARGTYVKSGFVPSRLLRTRALGVRL